MSQIKLLYFLIVAALFLSGCISRSESTTTTTEPTTSTIATTLTTTSTTIETTTTTISPTTTIEEISTTTTSLEDTTTTITIETTTTTPQQRTVTIDSELAHKLNTECKPQASDSSIAYQSGAQDMCDWILGLLGIRENKFKSRPTQNTQWGVKPKNNYLFENEGGFYKLNLSLWSFSIDLYQRNVKVYYDNSSETLFDFIRPMNGSQFQEQILFDNETNSNVTILKIIR